MGRNREELLKMCTGGCKGILGGRCDIIFMEKSLFAVYNQYV